MEDKFTHQELEDFLVEGLSDFVEEFLEGRERKVVIRGGKRKVKYKATGSNQKIVGGKATHQTAAERVKRSRGQRKGAIKRKAKQTRTSKKRMKSMKKRQRFGLAGQH